VRRYRVGHQVCALREWVTLRHEKEKANYEYRDEKVGVGKQKKIDKKKRTKWVWFTLNYTCDEPKNVQGVLFKT
jgi:hypothetical protein